MSDSHPGADSASTGATNSAAKNDTSLGSGADPIAVGASGRRRAIIALAVAVLLIFAVVIAGKLFQDSQARNAVSLSNPELPDNDSAICNEIMDRLPGRVDGLVRAEIAEPVPAGAAVWRDISDSRVTLRCGTFVPAQYNPLASTFEVDGIAWLPVSDAADDNLVTWFSVGRSPVVAVTSSPDHEDALGDLSEALKPDDEYATAPEPNPVPLAQMAAPEHDERCRALEAALPNEIAGRNRINSEEHADIDLGHTVVWASDSSAADDGDVVSLLCGVEMPESYEAGQNVTQIGEVVWFDEPTLSAGSTSVWFSLGRERLVAVHVPMNQAQTVLPQLSTLIANNLANTSPSE